MKSNFTLMLCGVLICALSFAVADDTDTTDGPLNNECFEQYLKKKGKVAGEINNSKRLSMCPSVVEMHLLLSRERIEKGLMENIPNETNCVMAFIDEKQVLDFILEFSHIKHSDAYTEDQRTILVDAMEKKADDMLNMVTTACGVTGEQLKSPLFSGYPRPENALLN